MTPERGDAADQRWRTAVLAIGGLLIAIAVIGVAGIVINRNIHQNVQESSTQVRVRARMTPARRRGTLSPRERGRGRGGDERAGDRLPPVGRPPVVIRVRGAGPTVSEELVRSVADDHVPAGVPYLVVIERPP